MGKNHFLSTSCNEFAADHKFNCVDIIKFLFAYLVLVGHIDPFNVDILGTATFGYANFVIQKFVCRIIVPFYFATSGLLLFRKMDLNDLNGDRIKGYCFKILRLLGTWYILLFAGGTKQLWYLRALVVAVIVLSVLIRKGLSLRLISIISLVLFLIGLFGDSYHGFLEPLKSHFIPKLFILGYETLFPTTRNGIFFGLLYVLMGVWFAKKRIVINKAVAIIGFIVSFTLMFFEVNHLERYSQPKDYNIFLFALPATFFLFYIATHIELKDKPIYSSLRAIGMLVFLMHLLVDFFVCLAISAITRVTGIDLTLFRFVITVVFTTALAIIIERLSRKEKFKWLKYIYS